MSCAGPSFARDSVPSPATVAGRRSFWPGPACAGRRGGRERPPRREGASGRARRAGEAGDEGRGEEKEEDEEERGRGRVDGDILRSTPWLCPGPVLS